MQSSALYQAAFQALQPAALQTCRRLHGWAQESATVALTISGSAHHFQTLLCQDDGNAIPDALVGCSIDHTVSACLCSLLCWTHVGPQSQQQNCVRGSELTSCHDCNSVWCPPALGWCLKWLVNRCHEASNPGQNESLPSGGLPLCSWQMVGTQMVETENWTAGSYHRW